MPFYEYVCDECGHRFERFQKMSDPPVSECEACGGSKVRRVIFPSPIIFKGSGFYCTDYKKSASTTAPADKNTSGTSAKNEGGAGSKTEPSSSSGSSGSEKAAD